MNQINLITLHFIQSNCSMRHVFKLLLITGLLIFPTTILVARDGNDKSYLKSVRKERKKKDIEFANTEDSPLDPKYKPNFNGLEYFNALPSWKITARIERFNNPDTIKMKTTTERLPLYLVYGKAYFSINGKDLTLTIFRNVGLMSKPGYEDYLFVPFTDETSGQESYGGGRYIDARVVEGDILLIDFNKAYNPYCVYSKKYSCPVPPAENFLPVKITAGEKDFKH